jgi:putative ABC transport system permease protein
MSFLMTFRIALKALARNKLRTVLTMLGMIIGVAAVITMVALGNGAQAAIEDQIRGSGTNMITIFPGSATTGGARQGGGTSSRLTVNDTKALRQLPELDKVSEGVQTQQQIIAGAANWRSSVIGVNVDYVDIKSWPMKTGAFFTDHDVSSAAKVCTLGVNVAQNLFGDEDPTGEEISTTVWRNSCACISTGRRSFRPTPCSSAWRSPPASPASSAFIRHERRPDWIRSKRSDSNSPTSSDAPIS